MNRRAKRIIGNISVGAFLAGVLGILAVNHFDPDFLKNDAELTAEANAGTPIVQGPNCAPDASHSQGDNSRRDRQRPPDRP